jgi:hypothetical protein
MATLIASSRDFNRGQMLTYTNGSIDHAVNTFIDRLFADKLNQAHQRLEIRNGRYFYTPSNEYTQEKSIFIRAKFSK